MKFKDKLKKLTGKQKSFEIVKFPEMIEKDEKAPEVRVVPMNGKTHDFFMQLRSLGLSITYAAAMACACENKKNKEKEYPPIWELEDLEDFMKLPPITISKIAVPALRMSGLTKEAEEEKK